MHADRLQRRDLSGDERTQQFRRRTASSDAGRRRAAATGQQVVERLGWGDGRHRRSPDHRWPHR
jgi:hypothetical protein